MAIILTGYLSGRSLKQKQAVEGFEDYIPPYKNLGAIFIKAYKKAMGDEEEGRESLLKLYVFG